MSEFIWNNTAFNSEDEMNLAKEIPGVYLDRWNDAGSVAEAILSSDWLSAHDREASERTWIEGYRAGIEDQARSDHNWPKRRPNPYREESDRG